MTHDAASERDAVIAHLTAEAVEALSVFANERLPKWCREAAKNRARAYTMAANAISRGAHLDHHQPSGREGDNA